MFHLEKYLGPSVTSFVIRLKSLTKIESTIDPQHTIPARVMSVGRVLVAVAALAAAHNIGGVPVGVVSFTELRLAVESGTPSIEITVPEIVFDHQLVVLHEKTALTIESTIGATLSGGHKTRLFILQSGSKLSLRGIELANGMAQQRFDGQGGAILASAGSELRLHSVRLTKNRAIQCGAISTNRSTVIVTDSTMSSNSAVQGGAVCATQFSTILATTCTMTSNSALSGGVIAVESDSTAAVFLVLFTSNTGSFGGALFTSDSSTMTATNCTLISNSAYWGGAVASYDVSSATMNGCTITSNSASSGGAFVAVNYATVVVTDCTMRSNTAVVQGGVVALFFHSAFSATDCAMCSNTASMGGVIYANGDSAAITKDCTMTSNYVNHSGGAVQLDDDAAFTATNCTITSNSASQGSAILVGGSGTVSLVNSAFQSNIDANAVDAASVGIVNLHGQVQCDAKTGCFPVCTVCQDAPTLQPTGLPPALQPMGGTRERKNLSHITWLLAAGLSCGVVAVAMAVSMKTVEWRRRLRGIGGVELSLPSSSLALTCSSALSSSYRAPLLEQDSAEHIGSSAMLCSAEYVGRSAMLSYERSLAPIFVVGGNSMLIKWSPGMAIAVPTNMDPVGSLVSGLPFVNPRDGDRFDRNLRRIFEAPAEHDSAQTFMLHFHTRNGRVLLEMRADYLVAESPLEGPEAAMLTAREPIVVVAGRQVDSDLACMMAPETDVAVSESDGDVNGNDYGDELVEHYPSVSEVGCHQGDDTKSSHRGVCDTGEACDDERDTAMQFHFRPIREREPPCKKTASARSADDLGDDASSVTMHTKVSSLTMPTLSGHSKVNMLG